MKLIVNPHKIEIIKEPVNEREIDITKCEFEFAPEITNDYVKEAYFTFGGETYKEIIINNECSIPNEVLVKQGQIEIGVVAFLVESEEEIKRYNPSPAYFNTWVGSLKDNPENSEPITPSEMEQYEQALNDGLAEVANVDIDAEKVGHTATVTITNRNGEEKSVQINDGEKGDTGNGISNINKTSTSGLVDTYTISYTDSPSTTFNVTNGKDGQDGADGKDYVITQQDYNTIAGIVETDIQPTLTNIQNTANTANGTANTAKETADTASGVASSANTTANTAKSIAEGANRALSYSNYSTMITAFNALDDDVYRVGQNMYILTLDVPDLWISSIESTSSTYTYTTDEAFENALSTNGYVQVGYYKLSALETQKVDLTNYATKDEFVTLTQAQYDNLQTINPDVYYYIIEE